MKIAAVDTQPFSLERMTTVATRGYANKLARHVLVVITAEDGSFGVGEALAKAEIYGETQASIEEIIATRIAPSLVGLDVFALDAANDILARVPANNAARAAVDIALHDLAARRLGVPLYRWWGGDRGTQPVTWTVGLGKPESMLQEAIDAHDRHGIRSFKLKGGVEPADDIDAVRLIRERLGPEIQLSVDPNEGYRYPEAARTIEAFAALGVDHVEEPLPRDAVRARIDLARRSALPILGDDSCFTLADARRELEWGTVQMISIKVPRTGFWQSFKIAALAEAFGAAVVVGTAVGGALSGYAAAQFGCSRSLANGPSENAAWLHLGSDLVPRPTLADGQIRLDPDAPGLGVTIDPARLAGGPQTTS